MKKLFLLPLLALVAMSAYVSTTYTVNTAASNIVWKGYKVTGQHTGNVKVKNGSLVMTDGKLTSLARTYKVNMATNLLAT
jgi:uncharacterized membrane protein